MDLHEPSVSLGIALAAGLLIGIEREQSRGPEGQRGAFVGGIRAYPLFALLGGLTTLLSDALTSWLPLVAFLALIALMAISYADDVHKDRDRGLTTEVSCLVTFLLGALSNSHGLVESVAERAMLVAGLAVVVTFLLSSKPRLSLYVERVSTDDLYATVKFLIVVVLVLPLLPNRTLGPLDVVNPFHVGLLIVLLAVLSFIGYVASRALGAKRGFAITALMGGLVSSTAVTVAFAERVRKQPAVGPLAAATIVLASTVMLARVLLLVAVVYPPLVRPLALPVACMGLVGAISAGLLYRGASTDGITAADLRLSNPFELATAMRFGLVFAAVLIAQRAAELYVGPAGIYATAAVAGTSDVDAITLSVAKLARGGLALPVGVATVLIGVLSNTVAKAALSQVLGHRTLFKLVVRAFALSLAGGGLGVALDWALS